MEEVLRSAGMDEEEVLGVQEVWQDVLTPYEVGAQF